MKTVFSAALVFGLFALVGVMHTAARAAVVQQAYRLSQIEDEHRKLARENERLKLELATLRSPARLEAFARRRLAMVPPDAQTIMPLAQGEGASWAAEHRLAQNERGRR